MAVLLDGQRLGDWNPAISVIGEIEAGVFAIKAHGLAGKLTYGRSGGEGELSMRIRIPGLLEEGDWVVEEHAFGSLVRHHMRWSGPLVPLIGAREASKVPALRIARLREWTLAHHGMSL